jgi:hypothetical protein
MKRGLKANTRDPKSEMSAVLQSNNEDTDFKRELAKCCSLLQSRTN